MTQALVFPLPDSDNRVRFTQPAGAAAIAERIVAERGAEESAAIASEVLAQTGGGAEVHRGVDLQAAASSAPRGVDADRFALNQRVEAYMAEHGCDIDTAIRAVAGGQGGAPASVDNDRHAMNQKVEEYLAAHPDATMSDAISAVAGASR